MLRISPTVKHLIIINTIIFIGTFLLGNRDFFYSNFSLFYPLSVNFEYWQIITHMFMHGDFRHLLFNMFALWMFGTAVEQVLGQKKFLGFYFSCGFGAVFLTFLVYLFQIYPSISSLQSNGYSLRLIQEISELNILDYNMFRGEILAEKMQPLLESYGHQMNLMSEASFRMFFDLNVNSNGSMVGASGAIMGILVAFAMLNPNAELMLILLPIPIKAKYFIPAIIALDLFSAVTGVSVFSPSNTAYIAHVGGALTGFILMYFWKKNRFDKYRWN